MMWEVFRSLVKRNYARLWNPCGIRKHGCWRYSLRSTKSSGHTVPRLLLPMYNACLTAEVFSSLNTACHVLISKGNWEIRKHQRIIGHYACCTDRGMFLRSFSSWDCYQQFGRPGTCRQENMVSEWDGWQPVSYTHLDVYKRQSIDNAILYSLKINYFPIKPLNEFQSIKWNIHAFTLSFLFTSLFLRRICILEFLFV